MRNLLSARGSGWMILWTPSCTWKNNWAMPLVRSVVCKRIVQGCLEFVAHVQRAGHATIYVRTQIVR